MPTLLCNSSPLATGKATPHINLSEDIYLGFNVSTSVGTTSWEAGKTLQHNFGNPWCQDFVMGSLCKNPPFFGVDNLKKLHEFGEQSYSAILINHDFPRFLKTK